MTKRILFVDDSEQIRAVFTDLLPQIMDVEIVEACDCAEGRERLSAETFDALVLDGNLPDGMGPALYVEFRDQLRAHGTHIVVHSGEDARDLREKFPVLVEDNIPILLKGADPLDEVLQKLLYP